MPVRVCDVDPLQNTLLSSDHTIRGDLDCQQRSPFRLQRKTSFLYHLIVYTRRHLSRSHPRTLATQTLASEFFVTRSARVFPIMPVSSLQEKKKVIDRLSFYRSYTTKVVTDSMSCASRSCGPINAPVHLAPSNSWLQNELERAEATRR